MIIPPDRDAIVPSNETPPLVPGGTDFNVIIKIGGDFARIPSSDARVSPRQHAKCLNNL